MNIWVFSGMYDGELFASSHLTEKGAFLTAIADIMRFTGHDDDQEDFLERYGLEAEEAPPSDMGEMRKMPLTEIVAIYRKWADLSWDNQYGYQTEIIGTRLGV